MSVYDLHNVVDVELLYPDKCPVNLQEFICNLVLISPCPIKFPYPVKFTDSVKS